MMKDIDYDFWALPFHFRKGVYLRRENFEVAVNPDIPEQFRPESGTVVRSRIVEVSEENRDSRFNSFNHESINV